MAKKNFIIAAFLALGFTLALGLLDIDQKTWTRRQNYKIDLIFKSQASDFVIEVIDYNSEVKARFSGLYFGQANEIEKKDGEIKISVSVFANLTENGVWFSAHELSENDEIELLVGNAFLNASIERITPQRVLFEE